MSKKYQTPSLRYPGGKARVAKKIAAMMPPHKTYVEPFAGAAHVFFAKEKAKVNVLNDTNTQLMSFFEGIKGRKICCKTTPTKEKFFKLRDKAKQVSVLQPCDYLYLNKNSYGGKNSSYGYVKPKDELCVDGTTLDGVKLTKNDFKQSIKQNDSKETLFYIDPPYVKANQKECLYGKGFCTVTPIEVAQAVKNIKGKAIISYDDHSDVRKAFKGFKFSKITLPYSLAKDKNDKVKGRTDELIIKNF